MPLTDAQLQIVNTPEDAWRLALQLLPDFRANHPRYSFRTAEQHLLTYALIDMLLQGTRHVEHLNTFLNQDLDTMSARLKGMQPPELEEHAAVLAHLSPPRLAHASWGVTQALETAR